MLNRLPLVVVSGLLLLSTACKKEEAAPKLEGTWTLQEQTTWQYNLQDSLLWQSSAITEPRQIIITPTQWTTKTPSSGQLVTSYTHSDSTLLIGPGLLYQHTIRELTAHKLRIHRSPYYLFGSTYYKSDAYYTR